MRRRHLLRLPLYQAILKWKFTQNSVMARVHSCRRHFETGSKSTLGFRNQCWNFETSIDILILVSKCHGWCLIQYENAISEDLPIMNSTVARRKSHTSHLEKSLSVNEPSGHLNFPPDWELNGLNPELSEDQLRIQDFGPFGNFTNKNAFGRRLTACFGIKSKHLQFDSGMTLTL